MRVSARVRANRANAKRSTGPKSKAGKTRAAQNSYKHGLSIPARLLPECSPAVENYLGQLMAEGASDHIREAAIAYAEAQVDVDRVRQARLALYDDEQARTIKTGTSQRLKDANRLLDLIERADSIPIDHEPIYIFREGLETLSDDLRAIKISPGVPTLEAGMRILAPKLAKLWRYEKRALSRRDQAGERLQILYAQMTNQGRAG